MLKGEKIKYYSQLQSFPWEMVAKSSCGITSAAMAISYYDNSVDPMDVLKVASKLHKVPKDENNYWVSVTKDFLIPVGQKLNKKFNESIEANKLNVASIGHSYGDYEPCFSIANGYDHRGSERLFKAFGIRAKMMGDKSSPAELDTVKNELRKGNMFLMSASRKNNPWIDIFGGQESNHIMLISDLVEKNNREYLYILDPFSEKRLVHIEPVEKMVDFEFNGYGTVIYTNEEN
jgi:hypothetical protein